MMENEHYVRLENLSKSYQEGTHLPVLLRDADATFEEAEPGVVHRRAAQGDLALDLLLTYQKGPILHGDRGYSQKGPNPGNASMYYSLLRLATSGTVQVGNATYPVTGSSGMDHEFSTSGLATDQVDWDWFALQLDNGRELMVFQLHKEDGSIDPYSSGTFIVPDGSTQHLSRDDLQSRTEDAWRGPRPRAADPARWTVTAPNLDLTLRLEPHLADQEDDFEMEP